VKEHAFNLVEAMIRMHLRSGAIMYELKYWREKNRPDYSLYRMLERLLQRNYTYEFANTLIKYHEFCILKSNDKDFVISDQFIVTASLSFKARFVNATNRTVGLKDVIILLPLSRSYYLCFYNGNNPSYIRANQLKKLTEEQTKEVNIVIMNNSYIQTAGPSFETLSKLVDFYDDKGPTAIYYGGGKTNSGVGLRKEVFYYQKDKLIYDFIVSVVDIRRFNNVSKNELCPCGSGASFGKCCRYKVREFDKFMNRVKLESENRQINLYGLPHCNFHEKNIFEYHTRN
jgi:hypothetical protein